MAKAQKDAMVSRKQDYEHQEALAIRRQTGAQSGDVYYFNLGEKFFFSWVIVSQHPDDRNMWFIIPKDDFGIDHLTGVPVVKVSSDDMHGPAWLYPDCGIWAKMEDIEAKGECLSFVSDDCVRQVRQMLAKMARGQALEITPEQEACENDPEYWEIRDNLEQAKNVLQKLLGA